MTRPSPCSRNRPGWQVACLILLALLVQRPAAAQSLSSILDALPGTLSDFGDLVLPDQTQLRVAVGPNLRPSYQGSSDEELGVGAALSVRYEGWLTIEGSQITLGLLDFDNVKIGPIVAFDFGRDETDDPLLSGMGDVGTSMELGGYVAARFLDGRLGTRLRVRWDVADGHNGRLMDLDASYRLFEQGPVSTSAVASVTLASNRYMDSFFSVNAAQSAASGYRAYDAGGGVRDARTGLVTRYRLAPQWGLRGFAYYSRLMGDAADSPLVRDVGSANQFGLGLFVEYVFEPSF